jgi:hypothetical protein
MHRARAPADGHPRTAREVPTAVQVCMTRHLHAEGASERDVAPRRGAGRPRMAMQNDQNDRRKRAAVPTACGMVMTAPGWARSRGTGK